MTPLRLLNLSAGYGARPVLHGISLNIAASQVTALVGPNGAGKSTLIRVLSGVLAARGGEARLNGTDLLRLRPAERARRVAVVPQMLHLPEAFTVGEIVLMGRTPHLPLWAGEGRRDCEVAWAAMRRAQVDELSERRADELSGGEQQRVVLARALAQEPQVLLLDEPTAHLDLKHQVRVLELVRELARVDNLTVLMTLHDLNQAALFADSVALMQRGEIVAHGSAQDVFTAERLSRVYGLHVAVGAHPVRGTPVVMATGTL
ncbi:MAG: heme ABC transporter ATP-binding protein [Anaerolineales bacterium]|nr:heme ABC transporter ATP-binding protein [Anaerolineales bacterium]